MAPARSAQRLDRARLLLAAGRVTEAEAASAAILATDPTDVDAILFTIECRLTARDGPGAEALWNRAISLDPDVPEVVAMGAWTALECDRPDDAHNRACRLVDIEPGAPRTAVVMAITAASLGKVDEALSWVRRLQATEPDSYRLLVVRAQIGIRLRDRPDRRDVASSADAAVREMLARDPEDPVAHRLRIALASRPAAGGRKAEAELGALIDAVRAGVPVHAQLGDAAFRALTAFLLLPWFVAAYVGYGLMWATEQWFSAVALAFAVWLLPFSIVARRRRRVLRLIPLLGRATAVRSATEAAIPAGVVCIAAGVGLLVAARPFDAAEAKRWSLGTGTKTVYVADSTAQTIPTPAAPSAPPATLAPQGTVGTESSTTDFPPMTIPTPGATSAPASSPATLAPPGAGLTGGARSNTMEAPPVPSTPAFTPPTVSIPEVPKKREMPTFDEDRGVAALRYLAAVGATTALVGALTTAESLQLRRLARVTQPRPLTHPETPPPTR